MQSGKAIPFIVKDSTNDTYHLTPQAEAMLANITTPLSVVTVAGLYRTGKSYLLNRVILNRSGGFGVGPTVNPCTKGLWVWGEPLTVGGRTLLVVDTEGLGALDEESNHDMKIFCLAVLLSSNFIYNSVGSIDETALQTLSLVLNLIASIDTDACSRRPSFLWVVRDFALQLVNDRGQQITASQYLQMALSTEHIKEPQKLQLRKTITDAFTERECFTLIKPLIDQGKLQNLDRVSSEELRPQFVSQTITLRKYIFQSLRQMRMGEVALKGSDYLLMCKRFLSAINTGAVPNLMDTWGYIREEKARQVTQQVRENYTERLRTRLNNKFPMPSARLADMLQHMRAEAEQEFLQLSYDETLNPDLLEFLAASEAEMQRLNSKESRAALNDILRREFEPFQKKLLSGYYSDASSYEQDLRASFRPLFQEKYSQRLDLPLLELDLYTERRIVEGIKAFEKRSRDELMRMRQARAETEGALQNQIRTLNRISDEERRRLQEEAFELEKRLIMITNEKQRAEEQLQKAKREEEAETGRLRRRTEEGQQQAEGLQRELARLQAANGEQEKQMFFLKKELEKQKALSRQKEEHLQNKLAEVERRSSVTLQQLQTNNKAWESEKRDMLAQFQSKHEQLMKERKELSDHLAQTVSQLDHERFASTKIKHEMDALRDRHQEELQRFRQRCASSAKKESKAQMEGQYLRELQQAKRNIQNLEEEIFQSQLRVRQLQEQLKMHRSQSEKQEAIASQRIQFQQLQSQELRSKLADLNAAYQRLFDSTQTNVAHEVELTYKRKISQLQNEHAQVIKDIENDFEARLTVVKKETASAIKERDEAQLQLALHVRRWQEREKYLLGANDLLQEEAEELKRRLSNTEEGHAESQREKETYYSIRVRQLEAQVDQIKRQSNQDLEDIAHRSEETVAFIKQCSEMEKAQFQRRLEEERDRRERKVAETAEEWSQRLAEEKEHLQGEIAQLEARMEAMENKYSQQLQNLHSDAQIRIQKITNTALEERMDLTKTIALLRQEIDITRTNLTAQLEERTKQYSTATESLKKELLFECEQQMRAAKQAMEELEARLETLKKANRKSEESNLLLKAELDREKAAAREKEQSNSRRFKELEQRFSQQLRNNTRMAEEMSDAHTLETRKLNEEIERLKDLQVRLETERTKLQSNFEQERNALLTKAGYVQAKWKRAKDDHEDLLRKFETAVKTLSGQNIQRQFQREMDESIQRVREEYKNKLAQKEATVNNERRENHEKITRLQAEIRSLRDKLLLYEMRQTHQSRYDPYEQTEKQPLAQNRQMMDRNRSRYNRQ